MQRLQRLSLNPNMVGGVDINPVTRGEIILYGETYNLGKPLDPEELDIFKAQFAVLLAAPGSEERKIMLDRLAVYVMGIRAIKQELNSPKFTGINPEDTEVGFGHLRPQFFRANSAYLTQWDFTAVANTWTDWLYETAGNAFSVGTDFGHIITHLKSLTTPSPFLSEAKFKVGRRGELIPVDTRALRLADDENQVAIVPIPSIITKPKATLYVRGKFDDAGTDEVALGGLVVGLGRVLKEETATWT
jgi:hypothetical protein